MFVSLSCDGHVINPSVRGGHVCVCEYQCNKIFQLTFDEKMALGFGVLSIKATLN